MVLGWLVSSSVSSPAPGSFLDFSELLAETAGRMFFHFCDRFLSRPSFPFFFSAISFLLPSVLSWYSWFLRSSVLSLPLSPLVLTPAALRSPEHGGEGPEVPDGQDQQHQRGDDHAGRGHVVQRRVQTGSRIIQFMRNVDN